MAHRVEVIGGEQVARIFGQLPEALLVRVRDRYMREACRPIRNAIKAGSPKRTGLWRRSIGTKLWPRGTLRRDVTSVMGIVQSRRTAAYGDRWRIAHLLEKGWRITKPGTGKTPERGGQGIVLGRHPGFQMFEKAIRTSGPTVRRYLQLVVVPIVKHEWRKLRRAG